MVREFSELPYNQFMSSWWEWLSRGVGMQTTVSTTVCEKNRDRPWGCTKPTGKLVAVTKFSAVPQRKDGAPVPGPWLHSARTVSADVGVEHDDP